jgi:hypothetical protein
MTRKSIVVVVVVVIAMLLLVCVYYFYDPSSAGWAWKCPMKALTGYDCPSCGNQRLVHALLHGRFVEAFHHNPFTMLSLPYLIPLMLTLKSNKGFPLKVRNVVQAPVALYIYAAAICVWWVLRNVI